MMKNMANGNPAAKIVTSQKTIMDFFAPQTLDSERPSGVGTWVQCPVCDQRVGKRLINYHLDHQCRLETPDNERSENEVHNTKSAIGLSVAPNALSDVRTPGSGIVTIPAHQQCSARSSETISLQSGSSVKSNGTGSPFDVREKHCGAYVAKARRKLSLNFGGRCQDATKDDRSANTFDSDVSESYSDKLKLTPVPTRAASASQFQLKSNSGFDNLRRTLLASDTDSSDSDDAVLSAGTTKPTPASSGKTDSTQTRRASVFSRLPLPSLASASDTDNNDSDFDSDFVCSKVKRSRHSATKKEKRCKTKLIESPPISPPPNHKRARRSNSNVDLSGCTSTGLLSQTKTHVNRGTAKSSINLNDHTSKEKWKPKFVTTAKSGLRKFASCGSLSSPSRSNDHQTIGDRLDDPKLTTLAQRALVTPAKFRCRHSHPVRVVTPESRAKNKKLKSDKAKMRLSKYDSKSASVSELSSSPAKSQSDYANPLLSPRSKAFLRRIPSCFDDLRQAISVAKVPTYSPRNSRHMPTPLAVAGPGDASNTAVVDSLADGEPQEKEYLMYSIRNFLDILQRVLEEEDDLILFNQDDLNIIRRFYMLTAHAQELYVRLFTRKHKWLLEDKILYPEIASDLNLALMELCTTGFLENGDNLNDMKTLLAILPAPRVKKLAKHLNLKVVANKSEAVALIVQQCKTQPTVFFGQRNDSSTRGVVIKKAKELLEQCYRLKDEPRRIFVRTMMLFSLTQTNDDSRQDEQPIQMVTIVMVNIGKLVFPQFQVLRQARIFRNRDDLIRYETAHSLEADILLAIEEKDWTTATLLCTVARQSLRELVSQKDIIEHDSSLPNFLKKFTAGHFFTRCVSHRVDLLQRLKMYKDAVDQLAELLDQQYYCQSYRGHWMERLALNFDQHLKMPKKALEIIADGLTDTRITSDHKLCLFIRLQKILKCKANRDIADNYKEDIPEINIPKAPEVYCQGRQVPFAGPGSKSAFELDVPSASGDHTDVVICSVEEVALDHYLGLGYTDGVHGEGASLVTIFCLLFWDIIYKSGIPDAFRSMYQGFPLDLVTSDFYKNRQSEIDERLGTIRNSTVEELAELVRLCWSSHENETSLVRWNLYGSCGRVQELVKCIGISHLASICERFCQNYRHFRSGVPDLTIWNSETLEWKMIEVKGPGDRLSNKQIEWLEFFRCIGVPAEVCHVQATGAKRLKKLPKESPRKITKISPQSQAGDVF